MNDIRKEKKEKKTISDKYYVPSSPTPRRAKMLRKQGVARKMVVWEFQSSSAVVSILNKTFSKSSC